MAKVQGDKQRLGKAYLTGAGLIALIAMPLSFVIVLLAKEIVMILLGPKWVEVVMPFQILAASLFFRMGYKMSESLARATGAVYQRAWRQFIYAGLVITGSYVGHFWGLGGVACGVVFALITNFFLMAQLSLKLTNITWIDMIRVHRYGFIAGILVAVISYGWVSLFHYYLTSDFLILLFTLVGTMIPMIIIVLAFPKLIINDDLKLLFDDLIVKKFKKKLR